MGQGDGQEPGHLDTSFHPSVQSGLGPRAQAVEGPAGPGLPGPGLWSTTWWIPGLSSLDAGGAVGTRSPSLVLGPSVKPGPPQWKR